MKVGTDGVLLGAWAGIEKVKKILDIGTGTGLIALMLAQRSNAIIDAIEIDKDAAEQAKENVFGSPWNDRITIQNVSLQEYFPDTRYDLIISNPPYFSDLPNRNETLRELARQNSTLSVIDLIDGACRLMEKTGMFALIYPYESFDNVLENATIRGLTPHRIMQVVPTPGNSIKRILAEFSYGMHDTQTDKLIIEEKGRHQYSEKYKKLTGDFYLNIL